MPRWTPESRMAQSALAHKNKPWQHSTGPKTPAGKLLVKYNAYKTGRHTQTMRNFRKCLRDHAKFLRDINAARRARKHALLHSQRNNTEKEYKSNGCALIFTQSRPILLGRVHWPKSRPPRPKTKTSANGNIKYERSQHHHRQNIYIDRRHIGQKLQIACSVRYGWP